jgi:hypothetical protein
MKIGCRIFVGSQTLKNIQDTKRYVINITSNPIAFVKATVGNLDEDEFTDDEDVPLMKDAEAYIYCKVNNIEKNGTNCRSCQCSWRGLSD